MARIRDRMEDFKDAVHRGALSMGYDEVKKSGMPPRPRAGFSMCVHKKRALLFGGVVDMEVPGDVIMSLFLNVLYGFQLDTRRWYPLELRTEKATKNKSKKNSDVKHDTDAPDNSLSSDTLIKAAEHEVDENMDLDDEAMEVDTTIDEISVDVERNMSIDNGSKASTSGKKQPGCSSKDSLQSSLPEVVKPCGRINSCMAVGRDTLYIYGGMMEVKDRKITLDDLYTLNLSKLDEWKCLILATETEWIEVSEEEDDDDEDEYEDDSEDEELGSGDDCDDSEDDEDVPEKQQNKTNNSAGNSGSRSIEVGDAVAILEGENKKLRRKEKRARIEQIRASLGLSDSQRTPTPGESLKDFYKCTNMYWQMAAYEHTQHTGKAITPEYKAYQEQVLNNCAKFAERELRRCWKLFTLPPTKTLPGDVSAMVPCGIRRGTPALLVPALSKGFIEEDFAKVVDFFDVAVKFALKIKGEVKGCGPGMDKASCRSWDNNPVLVFLLSFENNVNNMLWE